MGDFNGGGTCFGPRYFVPFMPWLALAAVVGFKKEGAFAIGTRFLPAFAQSDLAALIIFLALTGLLFFVAAKKKVASGK